jgi:hypothetical protein
MEKNDAMRTLAEHATADHVQLSNALQELGARLSRRDLSPGEVVERLENLRRELLDHYRHEEASGFFREVVEVAPRLKSRADALMQEHVQLRQQMDNLIALARTKTADDPWWQSVTEALAAFETVFAEHERREDAVLQEAYIRDIGTDD